MLSRQHVTSVSTQLGSYHERYKGDLRWSSRLCRCRGVDHGSGVAWRATMIAVRQEECAGNLHNAQNARDVTWKQDAGMKILKT